MSKLTYENYQELAQKAFNLISLNSSIRFGQALFAEDEEYLLPYPWPEVFYEKNVSEVNRLIYKYIETGIQETSYTPENET